MDATALPTGKLPVQLLTRLLGDPDALPAEVLVGPAVGEDACALALPGGVLVAASDPITLTGRAAGRHAVIVNANDVAVAGVRPRWFLAAVLLPPGTDEKEVEALFFEMRARSARSGPPWWAATARSPPRSPGRLSSARCSALPRTGASSRPPGRARGTWSCRSVSSRSRARRFSPPRPGASWPAWTPPWSGPLRRRRSVRASRSSTPRSSAATLGARALHDPTEGGLAAALHEMAAAAGIRLRVDRAQVLWFEPGVALCRVLGADPWATLASGALLAAFDRADASAAAETLRAQGWAVAAIATAEPGRGVVDTEDQPIPWPARDEVSRLLER